MGKEKKILILILVMLCLLFGKGMDVLALNTVATDAKSSIKQQLTDLEDIGLPNDPGNPVGVVVKLIKMVLGTVAFIFLVLILFAGFKWMISAGVPDVIDGAKKIIKAALIGLIIIFLAYALTAFVFEVMLSYNEF